MKNKKRGENMTWFILTKEELEELNIIPNAHTATP